MKIDSLRIKGRRQTGVKSRQEGRRNLNLVLISHILSVFILKRYAGDDAQGSCPVEPPKCELSKNLIGPGAEEIEAAKQIFLPDWLAATAGDIFLNDLTIVEFHRWREICRRATGTPVSIGESVTVYILFLMFRGVWNNEAACPKGHPSAAASLGR